MSPIAFMKNVMASVALISLSACGDNAGTPPANNSTPPETPAASQETATPAQPAKSRARPAEETARKVEDPNEIIIIATGEFTGASSHETTGDVSILRTPEGFKLVLSESFNFDGAPDPTIAFGNGNYIESTNFTKLNKNSGKQEYLIPTNIDPNLYSQVYIWCKRFSVPLGVAIVEIADLDEALDDTYGS